MTDFFTDAHDRLRTQVADFAAAEVAPRIDHTERTGGVDRELARLIAAQGWIGATIPREYAGMGAGHVAKTVIIEELARAGAAAGAIAQASQLGVAKLLHFGTDEQKQEWLPLFAGGSLLPTIAVTEHGSGSHVLGMQSTGEQTSGKQWRLSGRKAWVGNSHLGGPHGVVVRTGPGTKGLTAFLVEGDRPGVHVPPHEPRLGLHGFAFGELHLDGVLIPDTHRIGAVGEGLDVAYSSSLLYGRPHLTAVALGILRAAVDHTSAHVLGLRRYDGPLADLPTIRQHLGAMEARLTTSHLTAYHAVACLDRGRPCDPALMTAKHGTTNAAMTTARDALEIHGAAGLIAGQPAERLYRDAACLRAPAGTDAVQLHRLAARTLGPHHPQWSARLPTPVTSGPYHPARTHTADATAPA
ncbi:acyl-CoA dehydrogenase family protein [Streptomyces uncialis]|uniref:acyl-CoA dehydrogenase family protein n=1 Tax=Streptomyces uncialis TaxID=1048205 RepID=UPI0038289781